LLLVTFVWFLNRTLIFILVQQAFLPVEMASTGRNACCTYQIAEYLVRENLV
jgi:hypothetical protein